MRSRNICVTDSKGSTSKRITSIGVPALPPPRRQSKVKYKNKRGTYIISSEWEHLFN